MTPLGRAALSLSCGLIGCAPPSLPPVRSSPIPVAIVDDFAAVTPQAFDGASGTWLSSSVRAGDGRSDVFELGRAGLVERGTTAGDTYGATSIRSFEGDVSWLGPTPVRVSSEWTSFEPTDCRSDAYAWEASSALAADDVWAIVSDSEGRTLCRFDGTHFVPRADSPPAEVLSFVASASGLYALVSRGETPTLLRRPLDGASWDAVTLPAELTSALEVVPFESGVMVTGSATSSAVFVRVDASGAEIVARFELPTPLEGTLPYFTLIVGATMSDLWVRGDFQHFDGASGCGYDLQLRYGCSSTGALRWVQNVIHRYDGTTFVEVAHYDHPVDRAVPVANALLLFAEAQALSVP